MMKRLALAALFAATALTACGRDPAPQQYGAEPPLPKPERGLLPTLKISEPAQWKNDKPVVPAGYTISLIATDLRIPRQTLVLPNGDILVAEGRGGADAPKLRPKDILAGIIKAKGTTKVKGGNRLTLLRDANADGVYETRTVFAENLDAPYGLALANGQIYVANQDAIVSFPYQDGQTRAPGAPVKLTDLPSEINHHWTKSLTVSADGRFLYVGIGSNSNIAERGMAAEVGRAEIWQVDTATGLHKPFATGVRNPTALAMQPVTGQLWAVVNERDEIGPNLVPDYLTSIRDGGFYGWPYSYWGQNEDPRAKPGDPQKVKSAIRPDYALGSHVAALGVAFSTPAMGASFADGVFVGEHGSWNRNPPVGFKVIFVPFRGGRPAGQPINFVTGFLGKDGKARGRPVGVTVDPRGALIIADDLSNAIWRVTPNTPAVVDASAAPPASTGGESPAAAGPRTPY